jgi:hypothetical protein
MSHQVEVFHDGKLIYDIRDVQQVPSIGHQLDLRDPLMGEPGHMYTVVGVTWDLGCRSVELEVELTSAMPA